MSVTAKFKVKRLVSHADYQGIEIFMEPVYSPDPTSPNYSWSKWTPSGELRMVVTNPDAYSQLELGKSYLLTFTEAE